MADDLFSFAAGRHRRSDSDVPQAEPKPKPKTEPVKAVSEEEKVLTVTQLTRKVRAVLEGGIGTVWVDGEISNLRRQASGHQYFTLKDEGAQLSCVLFRGSARNLALRLEDGQRVEALGELSVYEPRGSYQLVVRTVRAKGLGGLQAQFEILKAKLYTEGLFDADRKRAIPEMPRVVCLVTSPTGAAVRDMLNILTRRAPWTRVLVYPVRVQGKEAPGEIIAALKRIAAESGRGLPEIDTVVVTRGGGSLEDLWGFNDEALARVIADFPLPIVSAVGHEIDFTISDFVADLRAPTPSAAAELIVPDGAQLRQRMDGLRATLALRARRMLREWEAVLDRLGRSALSREPSRVLERHEQELDYLEERLRERAGKRLDGMVSSLDRYGHALALRHPARAIGEQENVFRILAEKLEERVRRQCAAHEDRLDRAAAALKHLGPEAVFARGFSLTLDGNGQTVTRAAALAEGARITTRFVDGAVESVVCKKEKAERKKG
jgi:exodeoxyribonuclease VII large subunit